MKNKNWQNIHDEAAMWARWIALYEAVQYIADKAEERNLPFEKIDIKPLKVLEYMDSTQDNILRKLLKQEYNIDICYNEDAPLIYNEFLPKQEEYQYSP
jgi:hypothetical protein